MAYETSSSTKTKMGGVIEELKEWLSKGRAERLHVVITGKTGVGKSRLVNALIGKDLARQGYTLDPCTPTVTSYQAVIEGVTVTVWDSPGLQDGTGHEDQYIQDMKDNIKDIALMTYCVRMDEARFHDADKKAIQTLTDEFGKEVWNHAVVALTFANKVEDPEGKDDLGYFQSKLQEWEKKLKEYFTFIGINPETSSQSIPVIPVGNARRSMRLPDQENWLSHLWTDCYNVMKPSARRPMYTINRKRLIDVDSKPNAEKGDDEPPSSIPLNPEQKKLFFTSTLTAFFSSVYKLKSPLRNPEDTIKEIDSEPLYLQHLFGFK